MKRTNIVLDEELVGKALKLTGLRTQKALIHYALTQLVRQESQLGLLNLRGAVNWDGDLKTMRKGRIE